MRILFALAILLFGVLAIRPTPTYALTNEDFLPEKICVAGHVDKKLFMQAALEQKKCDACTSPENVEKVSKKWEVMAFLKYHRQNFPGKFYIKSAPLTPSGTIDYEELVKSIDQHMMCLDATPTIRTQLNKASKTIGEAILVRKDVDNLQVANLSTAKPASFGYSHDWAAGNTLRSYEVAVGHSFTGALLPGQQTDLPYKLIPYARFVSQLNSNPKKADTDLAAAGLRGDVYGVPILGLDNQFGLRGEYLTDSVADSSILLGEFIWIPLPQYNVNYPHPFGHPQYYFGSEGPYIQLDVSGRLRFGQVFDPGPTILTAESFARVGGKAGVTIGFGGYDILSKLQLYATYLYLDTVTGLGGTIRKTEAGVNFAVTDNFGFTFKYVEGRDEDRLDVIHKLDAGFTVKF
jgi:hypothetical protein